MDGTNGTMLASYGHRHRLRGFCPKSPNSTLCRRFRCEQPLAHLACLHLSGKGLVSFFDVIWKAQAISPRHVPSETDDDQTCEGRDT